MLTLKCTVEAKVAISVTTRAAQVCVLSFTTLGKANGSPAVESGVNEAVNNKFPGSDVKYGSAASGAGGNREIPLDEGGDINPATGQYVSTCFHVIHLDCPIALC